VAAGARPIDDAEALDLMSRLADPAQPPGAAIARIVEARDDRFVAVLIELMRADATGLMRPPGSADAAATAGLADWVRAAEALSGQAFGADWSAWVEWYGGTQLTPPPGFIGWKGALLARIDPRFRDFFRDELGSRIRVEEILWGGVPVDGIPALVNPRMNARTDAPYLTDFDPVFGLEIAGDARAYPLRIMDWHEMANDVVGGIPVSIAYCTLCGAAIAYDGRASDGRTYTFGSSGLLYVSNKLMYDHQTMTLWNQLTGEPVQGPLAGSGVRLKRLPLVMTAWRAWREQHPETRVLSDDTGYFRNYAIGAAYGEYFSSGETMFPVWQRSQRLPFKSWVYGLRIGEAPKAYPVDGIAREDVINDAIAGTPVVLVVGVGNLALQGVGREGDFVFRVGAEVRAYARGDHQFASGPDEGSVIDEAGLVWRMTEDALIGPAGQRMERIAGHLAYWFAWYAFFPTTEVYEP